MTPPDRQTLVLVESNTTGTGRLFCAAARAAGLHPVVLSRDPARYPYLALDAVTTRVVDTNVADAVMQVCAELPGRVVGVTSSSEYFIATAAGLAARLGLPHPDPVAISACRDKATQRRRLQVAAVPGADFDRATSAPEAVAAADALGYPVVVKPTTGSGSVGVRLCRRPAEVTAATTAILQSDPAESGIPAQTRVLVEQFLDGPEYSVETFDRQVVGITAKRLGPPPYFIEIGHDYPAELAAGQAGSLQATALAALDALGLGWGPAHVELRWTGSGPAVIEVNPRLAGGMIPQLVRAASGLDLIAATVARAAGRPVSLAPGHRGNAAIRFLVRPVDGQVTAILGAEAARRTPRVIAVHLDDVDRRYRQRQHSFRDRLGYVISTGEDGLAAANAAELALARLELAMAPRSFVTEPITEGV